MTQNQLALCSGVRQPNIAAYETGARSPSASMVDRLLDAARVRPSILLKTHRDAVLRIAETHRAGSVRVFGSVARGEDRPDSDIDLLVRFDKGANLIDLADLTDELEDLLGRHVDVVSEGGLKPRHWRILRDAVTV